jgi:hypothetical protein
MQLKFPPYHNRTRNIFTITELKHIESNSTTINIPTNREDLLTRAKNNLTEYMYDKQYLVYGPLEDTMFGDMFRFKFINTFEPVAESYFNENPSKALQLIYNVHCLKCGESKENNVMLTFDDEYDKVEILCEECFNKSGGNLYMLKNRSIISTDYMVKLLRFLS